MPFSRSFTVKKLDLVIFLQNSILNPSKSTVSVRSILSSLCVHVSVLSANVLSPDAMGNDCITSSVAVSVSMVNQRIPGQRLADYYGISRERLYKPRHNILYPSGELSRLYPACSCRA